MLATRARNLKAYVLLFSTPYAFSVDMKNRQAYNDFDHKCSIPVGFNLAGSKFISDRLWFTFYDWQNDDDIFVILF